MLCVSLLCIYQGELLTNLFSNRKTYVTMLVVFKLKCVCVCKDRHLQVCIYMVIFIKDQKPLNLTFLTSL